MLKFNRGIFLFSFLLLSAISLLIWMYFSVIRPTEVIEKNEIQNLVAFVENFHSCFDKANKFKCSPDMLSFRARTPENISVLENLKSEITSKNGQRLHANIDEESILVQKISKSEFGKFSLSFKVKAHYTNQNNVIETYVLTLDDSHQYRLHSFKFSQ